MTICRQFHDTWNYNGSAIKIVFVCVCVLFLLAAGQSNGLSRRQKFINQMQLTSSTNDNRKTKYIILYKFQLNRSSFIVLGAVNYIEYVVTFHCCSLLMVHMHISHSFRKTRKSLSIERCIKCKSLKQRIVVIQIWFLLWVLFLSLVNFTNLKRNLYIFWLIIH